VKRDWWVGRGGDEKGKLGIGYLGFGEVEGWTELHAHVLFYDHLILYFRSRILTPFLRL